MITVHGYEVHYGLTPRLTWSLAACLAFVLIGLAASLPVLPRLLIITVFGLFSAQYLAMITIRKLAFRADQAGITLGGSPPPFWSADRFFAWTDIERIVFYRRRVLFGSPVPYLGIQCRPGAPTLSLDGQGRADRPALHCPAPGVKAGAARSVALWRLDRERLAAIAAAVAPSVEVITLGTGPLT